MIWVHSFNLLWQEKHGGADLSKWLNYRVVAILPVTDEETENYGTRGGKNIWKLASRHQLSTTIYLLTVPQLLQLLVTCWETRIQNINLDDVLYFNT